MCTYTKKTNGYTIQVRYDIKLIRSLRSGYDDCRIALIWVTLLYNHQINFQLTIVKVDSVGETKVKTFLPNFFNFTINDFRIEI